jgi:hypothetical protein
LKHKQLRSPQHAPTGSLFTAVASGTSNRSKYSSNNRLTRSTLFAKIRQCTLFQQAEQKNLEIELLKQAIANLGREQEAWRLQAAARMLRLAQEGVRLRRLVR